MSAQAKVGFSMVLRNEAWIAAATMATGEGIGREMIEDVQPIDEGAADAQQPSDHAADGQQHGEQTEQFHCALHNGFGPGFNSNAETVHTPARCGPPTSTSTCRRG